jgi:putative sterol carrier protein
MTSPATALEDLVKRFSPAAAEGLTACYQLELIGEGGDLWHITISEQACSLTPGPASTPDVAITVGMEDWEDLISGRLDPLTAYITGKLQIAGDLSLATRLGSLFDL